MNYHSTGCLLCGKELEYFDQAQTLKCGICGKSFESTASCTGAHFVCDICHSQTAYQIITDYILNTKHKNSVYIAREMMNNKLINMHGPEHHYLIVAALLAGYKNSGGAIDLEESLLKARDRTRKVPGGICGLWGACGAGIGAGIFISIVSGATPLSEDEWSLANQMTALTLKDIAQHGGPRCCKRNTYLSILTAIDFVKEHLDITMEKPGIIQCSFFHNNPSCKKAACLFYPY